MGAHSAKNPAPGRQQLLEERTAIHSREPVEIAAPAIQDDPTEWHKKVHEKAAALGAELIGIASMDPLWIFEGCKTDKPWIIMLILTTLTFVSLAMKGGSYVYYFENYIDASRLTSFINPVLEFLSSVGINFFGNDPVSAGFGLFNAGGIVFMIVGIGLSKALADKYGKRNVFGLFLLIATLFIIAFNFFESSSIELIFGAQILHGFFYGITIPLLWAMIADVADYSEWKNNRRATAIIFSAMMVGLKLGLTIGSSLVTKILDYHGYDANSVTGQTSEAIQGTKLLVSIYPAIPFLLGVGLLFFYEINKTMETQIELELKQRRNT